ncbi:hypothetical protein BTR23_09865 [Alkalihalophilus pseudofirmus]|nr:hypothetical protein BTR23_09865 [Alkalihalophilus pseudofirmus]
MMLNIFLKHFPKTDWTDQYYGPLKGNLQKMEQKYAGNEMALKVVQMLRDEIKLYENYSNDYSYASYGMRKISKEIVNRRAGEFS